MANQCDLFLYNFLNKLMTYIMATVRNIVSKNDLPAKKESSYSVPFSDPTEQ